MPDFDIVRKSVIPETFRVSKIRGDFDFQPSEVVEHFQGEIKFSKNWKIGVIYGASGTGKSTIARQLFGDWMAVARNHDAKNAVVDDMPKGVSVDQITKMFYSLGFSSVPSWLKPYNVLSNGEKMRVDLAEALLQSDKVCFDEYTSVVDRTVAKVMSMALRKTLSKGNWQFVAVTCHKDILEWLNPDWAFCTDTMTQDFHLPPAQKSTFASSRVDGGNGASIANITI